VRPAATRPPHRAAAADPAAASDLRGARRHARGRLERRPAAYRGFDRLAAHRPDDRRRHRGRRARRGDLRPHAGRRRRRRRITQRPGKRLARVATGRSHRPHQPSGPGPALRRRRRHGRRRRRGSRRGAREDRRDARRSALDRSAAGDRPALGAHRRPRAGRRGAAGPADAV
ncbi:MAG: hypothetical protein AVDCRST_MAG67-3831, partial [uncultured Solirubrobacteraceae bacterium]